MRVNKILLVGIFLLAILTIGAVSASDNNLNSTDLSLSETDIISDDDFDDDEDDYDDEDGDDDDIWDEFSINWEVKKDVYYLDNDMLIASLQLPKDVAGELEVWKDGRFFANFPLTKGQVNVTLGDLKFQNQTGTHSLIFTYAEGDYYVEQYIGTIKLVDYEFKAPQNSILGQKFKYSIDFHKDISGILVVGDQIIDEFDLTETFYKNFTITNGICNIALSNLRLGRHYFTFECEEYDICLTDEFWVYPPVNVKNQIIIGQDSFFTLDLAKNASGEVMFTLYNKDDYDEDEFDIYYEDGEFEINSASLAPGHYEITSFTMIDEEWGKFSFEESPNYDDEEAFISFTAAYPSNTLIVANNVESTYTEDITYKVKVTIAAKAIEDASVVF